MTKEIANRQGLLQDAQRCIVMMRGQQVLLDFQLARLYGVETRVLKQAVRRNIERFPEDFMFSLTPFHDHQRGVTICDTLRSPNPRNEIR